MICLKLNNYKQEDLSNLLVVFQKARKTLNESFCTTCDKCGSCSASRVCEDLSHAIFFLEKKVHKNLTF